MDSKKTVSGSGCQCAVNWIPGRIKYVWWKLSDMETSFGAGLLYVLCLHFGRCDGVLADRETHEQTAESRKGCRKGLRAAEKDLWKAR